MNEAEAIQEAKKRVEKIKGFYTHLFVYLVVNLFLFFINYTTSPGVWWFYWPLFGWGIGVVINGFSVFISSTRWEERKIKEITEQLLKKEERDS